MPQVTLQIINGGTVMEPLTENDIQVTLEKRGAAGRIDFTVIENGEMDFELGNTVKLLIDGALFFYGFVFEKSNSKDGKTSVTAYDQLRYLIHNKFSYIFEDKTADEIIKVIATDYLLNLGTIDGTDYPFESYTCENKTLMDTISEVLDRTYDETGNEFILFDDGAGKLSLRHHDDMKTTVFVDATQGEDYSYESSIDKDTYNDVVLVHQDTEEIAEAHDQNNISKWGLLRLLETVTDTTETVQTRAAQLLEIYNRPSKKLSVSSVFGNSTVRGGSLVTVNLKTAAETINQTMGVYSVTHVFQNDRHIMNLTLEGGEFSA
ncbi:MAG: hypothetical protein LBU81_00830 [Methanosarcinales archaeon]|nr:hypothetical protein [Methanosarcinales archaeon]